MLYVASLLIQKCCKVVKDLLEYRIKDGAGLTLDIQSDTVI